MEYVLQCCHFVVRDFEYMIGLMIFVMGLAFLESTLETLRLKGQDLIT